VGVSKRGRSFPMPTDDPAETALYRAIKRRDELVASIKEATQQLEKIEQFIRTYREFSGFQAPADKGPMVSSNPSVVRSNKDTPPLKTPHGQAQLVFEQLVRSVLRDVGRPLRSPEVIEEFARRGHPIGGNETRTAWNRLWNAQNNGVLIQVPKFGYWLADEPVPPLPEKPPKHTRRQWGNSIKDEWAGRPKGRKRALTDDQAKLAQEWRAAGKSLEQIALDLGGIAPGTVGLYLRRLAREQATKKTVKLRKKSSKLSKS
jgi:hypothetical protein